MLIPNERSEAEQSNISLTNRYEVLSTDDEQSGIKSKATSGFKDRTAQGQHKSKERPNIQTILTMINQSQLKV